MMKSILPSKVYDVLKWVSIVCIPALVVFIKTVFPLWHIPYSDEISTTVAAVGVLLGALIAVSNAQYVNNKEQK